MTSEAPGHILLPCPQCGSAITVGLHPAEGPAACTRCGEKIPLARRGRDDSSLAPTVCLVCNSPHLYWQKDFNQRLGCLLVAIGAVLTPWTYGLSLAAMALVDLALYKLLPGISVCYICKARYRKVPPHPDHAPYELMTAQTWEARSENWASGKLRPAFTEAEAAQPGKAAVDAALQQE